MQSSGVGGAVVLPQPLPGDMAVNVKPPSGLGTGAGGAVVLPHPLPGDNSFVPPEIGYPEPPCCPHMTAKTSLIPCIPCDYPKPEPEPIGPFLHTIQMASYLLKLTR